MRFQTIQFFVHIHLLREKHQFLLQTILVDTRQQLCEPCPDCEGRGYIQSGRTICHKIFRELPKAAGHLVGEKFLLKAHPDVIELLEGAERESLQKVENKIGRNVMLLAVSSFHHEQFEITTTS